MANNDNNFTENAFVNSLVGQGTRFNGELDLNGLLRVDGDFIGKIRTPGKVLVGETGRAECSIEAGVVVVGGVVKGDIYASEKVMVLSSGIVIGNIFTPRLVVEEGVLLDGKCKVQIGKPGTSYAALAEENSNTATSSFADKKLESESAVKTFSGSIAVSEDNING